MPFDYIECTLTKQSGSDILSQLFIATPETGYTVDRWTVDGDLIQFGRTSFLLWDIQADHVVTVSFKPVTYDVYSSAGANGTIEPVPGVC